jgi:cytochrome c
VHNYQDKRRFFRPTEEKPPTESKSTSETAKQANPVKATPSSIASGRKSYSYDCAMCHGKEGAGDGDLAGDMHFEASRLP